MKIPIDQIIPDPNQPRKTFDKEAIKELASSFGNYGLISPLKVRPSDNQYMIIVGEMRYWAAKQRGDKEIEVGDLIEVTDRQAREMQLIENLQRNEVPALELGKAFRTYCEAYKVSVQDLAKRIGTNARRIGEFIALTKLSPLIQGSLHKLTNWEAKQIATISDHRRQEEVAQPFISGEVSSKHATKVCEIARKELNRSVANIVDDVLTGKAKKEEMERLEASKRAAGVILETPEELDKGAEALKKEARRKARQAMTPEKKAEEERKKLVAEARRSLDSTAKKIDRASQVMDVGQFRERLTTLEEALGSDPGEAKAQLTALAEEVTEAEKRAKAEAERIKDEDRKRKTAEENQKREERAEKKVRKQLLENHSFLGEVLAKAPTELIEERIYTPEQREILKKPSRPTTQWDRFNELEKLADKLSNGLAELPQTPAFAKMTLGITLQSLRARIDETLQRMGMQVVEGEVKRLGEG